MLTSKIKSLIAKLFLGIFVANILLATLAPISTANAQYDPNGVPPTQDQLSDQQYGKADFDFQSVSNLLQSLLLVTDGCGSKASKCISPLKVSAMQFSGQAVAGLYANPPASGYTYFADVINNFSIAKPAYAQTGYGYTALSPILEIWRHFRDFTYLFFVVILVVAGFGIMFRWKLNPQTVITIQSALPRIVIALILVTFSYAIAGLMIDLMYVMLSILGLVFGGIAGGPTTGDLQSAYTNGGFGQALGSLIGLLPFKVLTPSGYQSISTGTGWLDGIARVLTAINPVQPMVQAATFTAGVIQGLFGGGWKTAGDSALGSNLVLLIFSIIALFAILRLFLQLLQSYIAILLLIIFAPLQIALGVIPGMPGFGQWLKTLIAHLAVFIAVGGVLMAGAVLTRINTNGLWQPPFMFGSGFIADNFSTLIGFGIIVMIHNVPQAVKNAFGVRGLGLAPHFGIMGLVREGGEAVAQYQIVSLATRAGTEGNTGLLRFVPAKVARGIEGTLRSRRWFGPPQNQ